jgi:hypothetical protein
MTSANDATTEPRATVRIPTASGDEIEAWVYRPEGKGPHPAVVMAHGFAAVKAGGLEPFAERFCREGFTAIAFDYRQWGGSSGEPREEVSVPRQREDYRPSLTGRSPIQISTKRRSSSGGLRSQGCTRSRSRRPIHACAARSPRTRSWTDWPAPGWPNQVV